MTNKTLVFFGVGATISNQGTNSVFEVNDGARLRINGASLIGTTGNAIIRCEGSMSATHTLELFRTTLDNNNSVLLANPCTLTVDESTIRSSATTGYLVVAIAPTVAKFNRTRFVGGSALAGLNGANLQIANSTLKKVGAAGMEGTFTGGNFDVSYSTIIDSFVKCGSGGTNGLTLSNSILYNSAVGAPADTLQGQTSCTSVKYSVVFPNSQSVGATNVNQLPQLKNVAADDYHLLSASPAIDRGDPESTNAVDFDGTPRPQGSQRDSGAFEFKP